MQEELNEDIYALFVCINLDERGILRRRLFEIKNGGKNVKK